MFPDRVLIVGSPGKVVRELSDEERAAYVNQTPLTYRRAMERGLPQPEATELVPAGEATELEPIPAGEAAELDVETIQPGDLLLQFGLRDLLLAGDLTEGSSEVEASYGMGLRPGSEDARVLLAYALRARRLLPRDRGGGG